MELALKNIKGGRDYRKVFIYLCLTVVMGTIR